MESWSAPQTLFTLLNIERMLLTIFTYHQSLTFFLNERKCCTASFSFSFPVLHTQEKRFLHVREHKSKRDGHEPNDLHGLEMSVSGKVVYERTRWNSQHAGHGNEKRRDGDHPPIEEKIHRKS